MGQAYGFAGHVALAKETSGGTPLAATDYVEALSENFALNIERVDMVNIAGRLSEPDDFPGLHRLQGQIVFPFHPVNGGHFLNGVFGVQSASEVASGFLWTQDFTPVGPGAEWDAKFALQPYTFEIFRDAGSSQQYAGCQFSSLAFNITPTQDLRCTLGIIGISETDIANTTPTFPTSPTHPFGFDTASLSIAGAAETDVENMTITFDNQLEGIPGFTGSSNISKIRRTGFQTVRISGDIAFETIGELNNFRDQVERRYTLSVTRANSFQLVIDLPRVILTSYPVGITGRDRVVASFEGMGRYHSGSGNAIKVSLTTTQSYF